jgi:hypothetical protein
MLYYIPPKDFSPMVITASLASKIAFIRPWVTGRME